MSIYKMKAYIPVLYSNLKPNEDVSKEDFKVPLTDRQFVILKRLATLLMETKFTNKPSKMYMQYPESTQETVSAALGIPNINTIKGRIRYDSEKLRNMYEKDILEVILNSEDEKELDIVDAIIIDRINTSPRLIDSTQELFTIPLPKVPSVFSYQVSDDEFELIKAGAARISKKIADSAVEKLGDKGIGYISYLLDTDPVDSIDLKRRKELLAMIK